MLVRRLSIANTCKRFLSHETKKGGKRYIQTIPTTKSAPDFYSGLNYSLNSNKERAQHAAAAASAHTANNKWAKHSLTFPSSELPGEKEEQQKLQRASPPMRRSRASKFSNKSLRNMDNSSESSAGSSDPSVQSNASASPTSFASTTTNSSITVASEPPKIHENTEKSTEKSTESKATEPKKAKKPRRALRPRKALITLSPNAVDHLRGLLDQPEPQLIRIGVKNRGCSGLTYHLEYVTEPGKFDEKIEQDGVQVFIDSKALFSIVGSEMDWLDDKLSSRFIFKNPNSKGTCGCGESFMV